MSRDLLEKRLLYRSWHRGCKEMDILLGDFARSSLGGLTESEIKEYEMLLDINDADLYNWLSGKVQVPMEFDSSVFQKIKLFHEGHAIKEI